MDYPLTLTQFFERTRRLFHRKRMATRVPGMGLQWYSYADYADRVCRLAGALRGLGLQKGRGSAPSRGTRTATWRSTSRPR